MPLPAEIAVLVLVEFICNPKANFAQLAKMIKHSRKVTVEVAQIERLFQQYALKKDVNCGPASWRALNSCLQLVPKWCNIGYDILVYIGGALFQRYRTIQEVSTELYLRNVQISDSEISYLGYKFISILAACHQQVTPKIRQSMGLSGGDVLHLNATHDGNAPALMTSMDSHYLSTTDQQYHGAIFSWNTAGAAAKNRK